MKAIQALERKVSAFTKLSADEKQMGLEFPAFYREYFRNLLVIKELRSFSPTGTLE
jgi:hypothetical protein